MHRIQRLEEDNRIAAGEVIQRPASVIKELLENALDAGATKVTVALQGGGKKGITITDNGSGIAREDMPLLCERFATSKIREYDDLLTVSTFGFRGEALASISHIAQLSVTTKQSNQQCAQKASYCDGKLQGDPVASAGVQGTQFVIQNLFYNYPQRLSGLRSDKQEFVKCLRVMQSYAVHYAGEVSLALKKQNAPQSELNTPLDASRSDIVGILYGRRISQELLPFGGEGSAYGIEGLATSANFHLPEGTLLLFINNRLIKHMGIKKGIEAVYTDFLPKRTYSWVYLSLHLPPASLDVNVHPTKENVFFLDEEIVCSTICSVLRDVLTSQTQSRTVNVQTTLSPLSPPSVLPATPVVQEIAPNTKTKRQSTQQPLKAPPQKLVRTDGANDNSGMLKTFFENPVHNAMTQPRSQTETAELTSVQCLQARVREERDEALCSIVRNHVMVGLVDDFRAAVQYETKLLLVDTAFLSRELMYQRILAGFGRLPRMALPEPISMTALGLMALQSKESDWSQEDGTQEETVEYMSTFLIEKRGILEDYFSIRISHEGTIESIPDLLPGYTPALLRLPSLLLGLVSNVDWDDEMQCFHTIARELALFYQVYPTGFYMNGQSPSVEWVVQNLVFPAMKTQFDPPARPGAAIEIASVEKLYRHFERC